jgi:HTH-type transcriptional regulator / antitoxin HigA
MVTESQQVKPDRYSELSANLPPRLIESKRQLDATKEVINSLLDKHEGTKDEDDYLNLLIMLVEKYEDKEKKKQTIPDIHGIELLRILMEQNNISQKQLVNIFGTQSVVSELLSGSRNRKLSIEHIQKLAAFFNISPSAFLPTED